MTPGYYMPTEYLPLLLMMIVGASIGAIILFSGTLVRIKRPYKEKLKPYESGVCPTGEPREQFSIKFYITAMLFVIFDVEAVFLYPWAIVYDKIGLFALIEMILFIVILAVGYVYAWKKEAFVWD